MGEHDADKAEDMMVQEWRQMLLAIIVQVEPSLSSRVTLCPVMWFCRGEWRHLASDHEHGQILFVCGDICTHECDFAFVPTQNFCACVIPHELTLQACMSPSLSPHVGWFREETGRACTPIDSSSMPLQHTPEKQKRTIQFANCFYSVSVSWMKMLLMSQLGHIPVSHL